MANNAFDYWKRRSETGHRYAPVLDQNPAKREWQIRTAASRLTPIGSAATINSSRTTLSSPTSAAATFTPAHNSGSFGTTSSLASLNLESLEPDVLISTLSRSPTNGNIFTVLRKKLANKNPSDNWIDAYCKADGIHFLLDAWKTSRDRPLQKLSDAYFQRECMECLKVAMESPVTLDYVTDDVESQQKILAALDSSNVAVKKQAMDLLSSLCGHNQEGYQKVLDTFERYKAEKSDGSRFQLLVDELRQGKTSAYRTTLIALINAIICNNETLRSRIRIRNEFLALKLHDVLAQIRNDANHEDTDLFVQLDTFEEQKFADDANLSSPDGLDLTNLMDVFHAILAQVSSTPQEAVFLTLLQHLLQVDPNGTLGDVIWSTAEKLVHRASLLESKEDADLLLRPPVNVNPVHSKLDRLKSQHDLSSPIAVLSTLPSSDSPHQYSDIPVSNSVPPPPPPPPTTASPAAPPPPPPPAPGGPDNAKGSKGPPPPAPPKANPSQISSPGGPEEDPMTLLQQHIPKPKTKLKTLNWNKIPSHKIVGRDNLWTKTASGASSSIDFGAMEQLFAAPQSEMEKTKDVSVESDRKRKDSNEINLLEPKRSLNVNIFLKQFRSPNETIIDIIKSGKGDQIDADKLRSLLKILPESDEIDVLRSYEGNPARLGTAEKFILQLIDVPNYRLRIETMQFRSEYEANVVVLRSYVDAVILTAYDIKKNTRLHETLHMVLLAGNFLNTGGYAGNAAGFKLSSLLKLADIRANKPTMNLLHYVAEQASITNPDLLGFAEDMEYLQEAAKLSTENLTSEINCLNSKCQILIEQVEEADEEVQKKMHDFLEEAKVELKLLWLDGQEIEKLRIEMAEFFCEDAATFKLEDCFKIFQNFCIKFRKAVQENEQRKVQEEKAENRRKEEQEKRCRRQAAGELSDSALETSRSSISGWSSMPRRFSDRTCADEPISENGTVFKRDTLESGYASDTGAKKRARKMIRSSDEDDLMEYLNQGADGPSSRTSRTMAGEALPSFGRHSLRSRPAKSHDSSTENRERSTSGASHAVQTPSLTRQQNVEEWLCTNPSDSSADRSAAVAPYSKMNGTARPGSLNLQQESMTSPQVAPVPGQRSAVPSVEMPRRSTAPPLQTPTRTTSVVPEPVPATSPRIQQNFQPNPIGYATNGKVPVSLQPSAHQNSLSTTATLRNKWTPDSNEQKIQPVQQPRPWLPSKTLANTMHIFDPKAGCPGEPLSGTNSPASSSSENVQPTGGRSGEETDTDTINGSERGRKQLTATASQRLRKWRRLPATNGKIIDEEVLTDTSIEDHPRSGLSVRNQNPHEAVRKQSRTLREMRESKRGVPDVQPTSRRIAPSSSFTVADKMRRSRGDVTKSETDEPVQTARTSNGIMSVFDRLSAPKRTSPPLERSNTLFGVTPRAKTTVGAGSIAKKRAAGKGSDDNSDDAVSHVTSKSHGSDKSSGSSNTSASQATTKTTKVTLSSRGPNNNMTRAGDLGFLSKTRGGSQRNADGSFTTKVSDYTLAAAELPKVVNAALVLSAPVTSRMRH